MKDRIKYLLDRENVSSAQFASEIGISPSSLHHIVSGRNNPSLEVIQKILDRFPQINAEWLINGKGKTFKTMVQGELFDLPDEEDNTSTEESITLTEEVNSKKEIKELIDNKPPLNKDESIKSTAQNTKRVSKIIILYDDDTFDIHHKSTEN